MNIDEYKEILKTIEQKYWKDRKGNKSHDPNATKYSKNFWNYYNEKQFCLEHMDLTDVKSVLDIGAGAGLLCVLLKHWYKLKVEATDIKQTFNGGLYQEIFAHLKIPRHLLKIENRKPIALPKTYDMITMTRTVFDREEIKKEGDKIPDEPFDYEYFLDNIFQYCNRVFWKTNYQSLTNKKMFPKSVEPFLWWPPKGSSRIAKNITAESLTDENFMRSLKHSSMDKPYRAWYIVVNKKDWYDRIS